jgi:signal transduction histidine kinase
MATIIKKNKFTRIISCLLFASINSLFAQNTDSLLALLKTDKEDTNKVKHLNLISRNYELTTEYDKGLVYGKRALVLAQNLNFKKGIAKSYGNIGNIYMQQGNYSDALKNHFASLNIVKEINYKKGIASSYNSIGIVYMNQGNYLEALKSHYASLKLMEEIKDKKGIAISYNEIGGIYSEQGNYPEALKNHFISLKIKEELKDKKSIAFSYLNIGNVYINQGKYPEALKYYFEGLRIKEELKDKQGISIAYNNIGAVYMDMGNYLKAIENYFTSLKIKQEIGDKEGIATSLINLGISCIKLNKPLEANSYFNKALTISKEIGIKDDIRGCYRGLATLDSTMGNYKLALAHYQLFIKYRDSLNNEETETKTLQIAMQYESEKKEKEIAVLNADLLAKQKDQEILGAKIKEKNSIIMATVLGAMLLTISIFLFFSRRQLKQKNKHQLEINKQQEDTAIAIIQAQENERNRISQDLHDGIGTFLSTLKINLQSFEDSIPYEKMVYYKNTSQLVDKTSGELRNVMKNLSSETLQENGLVGALNELMENVNRMGLTHFNFLSHGLTKRLDNVIEINLYRVAQELINNCIKHAQATQATLQLIDYENTVLLMIEDNGKGFDTQNPKQVNNNGMGLKNIRNRVNFIKGTLKTESVLGKGSTFIIETPKHLVTIV